MASNSNIVNKSVWPYYSTDNIKKAGKSEEKTTLGKDQFLSILIKQLQYQDPLQPMEDKEFIAQMAQFTSLEQLMNISSQLTEMRQSLGAASSLIGKKVSWIETSKEGNMSTKSGVVDSILIRDGKHFAKIGKDEVLLDKIIQIENNMQDGGEVPKPGDGTTAPGSGTGGTGDGTTAPGSGTGGTGDGTTAPGSGTGGTGDGTTAPGSGTGGTGDGTTAPNSGTEETNSKPDVPSGEESGGSAS